MGQEDPRSAIDVDVVDQYQAPLNQQLGVATHKKLQDIEQTVQIPGLCNYFRTALIEYLNKYLTHFDFLRREVVEDFEMINDFGEELGMKHILKEGLVRTVFDGKIVKVQGPGVEAVLTS